MLQSESVKLKKKCTNFLKLEFLKSVCTHISFSEKKMQKPLHEIDLETKCEEYLNDLFKEEDTELVHDYKHKNIADIRENCLQFYITAAEEIRKRLLIDDEFLSKLKVLKPDIALFDDNRAVSFNDVSFIAHTLGDFDEENLQKEWHLSYDDVTPAEKENLSNLDFDNMWKKILQRRNSTNNEKYATLKSFVNAVRSLPNLNSDLKKMFSFLTDLKTKKTQFTFGREC